VELAGRHQEGIVKRWYILTLIALVGPAAWGGPARLSFRHLSGALYLATDAEYFPTNWLVYVGPKTVTVVAATWTPAMARTLSMRIRQVTRLPITAVIDTSPDPEWSGGNTDADDVRNVVTQKAVKRPEVTAATPPPGSGCRPIHTRAIQAP
jgi:hypothetical protein